MIKICSEHVKDIIDYSNKKRPEEACGIIAGFNGVSQKVYRMTNTADNKRETYYIRPEEQFSVLKEMRERDWDLLAIFHSHPETEAYPSSKDIDLAFYPEAVYIIVSLKKDIEIKGYEINKEKRLVFPAEIIRKDDGYESDG